MNKETVARLDADKMNEIKGGTWITYAHSDLCTDFILCITGGGCVGIEAAERNTGATARPA